MILSICLVLLTLSSLLSLSRMIKGPHVFDRLLSFDSFAISIIGIIVILSMVWKTALYIDIIILFSLFGFLSTISFCYYLSSLYQKNKPSDEN